MITTVIFFVYLRLIGQEYSWHILIDNMFCIDYQRNMDGTMWYMNFLLIWYTIFFCIFYFDFSLLAKIGLILMFGIAFRSYWLIDIFADCAWQFYTNALAFPIGICVGYAMHLYNRVARKRSIAVGRKTGQYILMSISFLLLLGSFLGKIELSESKLGLLFFILLYGMLSLVGRKCGILKWIGANSFILYLIEGKLITVLDRFQTLNRNPFLYCISYVLIIIVLVNIYNYLSKAIGKRLMKYEKLPTR